MRFRSPLLAGALLAAVAGGLAAGFVVSGGSAHVQGRPGVVARGAFHAVGWGTHGEATVVRERSGKLVLRFDASFHTESAPDLWVYVGRFQGLHGVRSDWTLAGQLHRSSGKHTYALATAPRQGDSVIVYCGKCDRAFGVALLSARA